MDNNKTVIKKSYTIKKEMLKNVAEIKQVIKVARKTHKTLLWCGSRNTGANYGSDSSKWIRFLHLLWLRNTVRAIGLPPSSQLLSNTEISMLVCKS